MAKKDLMKIKTVKGKIDYTAIIKEYGQKTVDILRSPNVSPRSGRAGRKTPYYLGWTPRYTKITTSERVTVWNQTNWQLTHLLENGHFITNRKDGLKWSAPIKHIRPTYRVVKPRFIRAMKKAKINIEIK